MTVEDGARRRDVMEVCNEGSGRARAGVGLG